MRNSSPVPLAVAIALIVIGQGICQTTTLTSRPSATTRATITGPIVELRVAGPAAMEQRLRPTHVGDLLGGEECKAIWTFATSGLRQMLSAAGDAEVAKRLERDLLGYAGELEVALWTELPTETTAMPEARGYLALWEDGETDLDKLAESLRTAIGNVAGPAGSFESPSGRGFDLVSLGGEGLSMTLPVCVDANRHLVVLFGTNLDSDVDGLMDEVERRAAQLDPKTAASPGRELFELDCDLRQLPKLMLTTQGASEEELASMDQLFGLSTWRHLRLAAETAGPRVQFGAEITFGPGDRALFQGVLPDATELPELLDRIPKVTATGEPLAFLAGHLDWPALYLSVLRIAREISTMFGGERQTIEALRNEANTHVDFDVDEDFLHYFTTEFAWIALPMPDSAEPSYDDFPFDDTCILQRVSVQRGESKPFDSACTKLREHPDLDVRETLEIEGQQVHRLGDESWASYTAQTQDLILFASGDGGLDRIRQLLRPVEAHATLPQSLRTRRRSAPAGWNLAGIIPAAYLDDTWATWLLWEFASDLLREIPGAPTIARTDLHDSLRALIPILEHYKLDSLAILGGHEPHQDNSSTSRIRVVW